MTRKDGRKIGKCSNYIIAIVGAIAVCLLLLAVLSHLILNGSIPMTYLEACIVMLILSVTFTSGKLVNRINNRGIIPSTIFTLSISIMMMVGGLLMEGKFQNIIRNMLTVTAGCTLSWLRFPKKARLKRGRNTGYR